MFSNRSLSSKAQANASRTPTISGANASSTSKKVIRQTFHTFGAQLPCLSVVEDFKKCWKYRCRQILGDLCELTKGGNFKINLKIPLDKRIELPKGAHPTRPQTVAITEVVQETLGNHVFSLVSFRKSSHGWLVELTLVPTRATAAPAEVDNSPIDYDAWWAQPPPSSVVLSDILPEEEGWTFNEPSPGGTQRANRSFAVAGGGIPVDAAAWWMQPPPSMQPPGECSSPLVVLSDLLSAKEGWTFDEPSPGGTQRARRSFQ